MSSTPTAAPRFEAQSVSDAEWRLRVDLAAAYRLCALYGWDDQLATHISIRLPGDVDEYLINPYGLLFEEITASSLVKVDGEGKILDDTSYKVNAAGFTIHSAIHRARHDARCIIHLHTTYGCAVSGLECGLLPVTIPGIILQGKVGYHDFEGVTICPDEQPRIVKNLGNNPALIFRNHGTLAVGSTMARAFHMAYFLERACEIQIKAMSSGAKLQFAPSETAGIVEQQLRSGFGSASEDTWAALLRKLERLGSDHAR